MTYKKKLIEVALPLEAINKEAAREKSIRHGHPSTLHLWWARRPLAACRAVLFASLVDDPSEYVAELLKDSAKRKAADKELKARKKLWDEMTCLLRGRQAAVLEKAKAGGLSAGAQAGISAPAPGLPAAQSDSAAQAGPEPKLEDIIAEIERERLFEIIRQLVKWENSNNERVLNAARAEIMRSCVGNLPAPRPDLFFVYAIECEDGSHYIGQTDDLKRRFFEHWEGKGADWCKHHKPVRIAHWEEFNSREEAVKREQDLKTGFGRKWLKDLIASGRARQAGPPPVYDPFCGGGSIPLEAQRLGLEAHASDLNPVPVLINKALIEIPPKFAGKPPVNPEAKKKLGASGSWKGAAGLAEDIRYYGQWMRDEAEKRIGHLYPKVKLPKELGGGEATVIAWLWARTVASPNPAAKGAHVPLVRSFWLTTKAGKKAWVEPVVDQSTMTCRFEVRTGSGEPRDGTVSRNGGICLLTGSPMPLDYIRAEGKAGRLGARLIAIVAEGRSGRAYISPNEEHERIAKSAEPNGAPDTDLPEQALGFRVQNYGMTKHRHLFTARQLVALTTFCDLVLEARSKILKQADNQAYADAVATYLGFLIGRGADYWSSNCSWHSSKELIRNTFARQALPIVWDYAETNLLSTSAGNFIGALDWVAKVLEALASGPPGFAVQCSATDLENSSRVAFSTDPPYYDNVPYADLSDFFYVWLRRCLQPVHPQLLGTVLVPKAEELIAEPFRHGGKEASRLFFEKGMGRVFERMRDTCDPRFPTTIYYAFKQAEDEGEIEEDGEDATASRASTGWETFLQGLIDAGWQLDGTWPMRTELGNRMRNLASNALASSIVLVCRPRPKDAGVASRRDFLAALKRELPEALRHLQKGNIAPVDLAQAAIGPGMAVFSRYAKVLETDGSTMSVRSALTEINKGLDEVLAEQEGEFDADTRWALAWFDQNGFNEGAYGVAETLCTAKNTSVQGMKDAGILEAKGGKVRLLKKEELDADWNPAEDSRLTIWEITHHLIRRLEQGESGAADLIQQLGAKAEVARDLSYRLYTICERRKWAQEAIAYNALVLSWSDVQRLAEEKKAAATPTQAELI